MINDLSELLASVPRGITVEPRSDGWSVRARINGHRPRWRFPTPEEAVSFAIRLHEAKKDGHLPSLLSADETLGRWFELWLCDKATDLRRSTVEPYVWAYTCHAEPTLGELRLRTIHFSLLQAWLRALVLDHKVGREMALKARSVVSDVLEYAKTTGAITTNPAKGLQVPPAPMAEEAPVIKRAVTPLFIERVVWMLSRDDDRLLTKILGYAGLRPQEALGLDSVAAMRDVLAMIRANVDGVLTSTKNKRRRKVPHMEPLRADVIEHVSGHGLDGPLFPSADGGLWDAREYMLFRQRFKRAARWAGDGTVTPYDLRAAYASMLLASGTEPYWVAKYLGDRWETVERHYDLVRDDPDARLPPEVQIKRARQRVAADPPTRPKGGRPRRPRPK